MAIATLLCVAATSCSKEQSELSLSDVVGTASVKGQICYNQGYNYTAGSDYYVPVSNKTVYIDVDLSSYDSNASGIERYTTTTDSSGNYSMTVPCSVSMETISVTVKVPSFTATYYSLSSTTGYLVSDTAAVYEDGSAGTATTLYSGDTTVLNIDITGPSYKTL